MHDILKPQNETARAHGDSSRMAGLDTLRGVAILAVVAFHVGIHFPADGVLDAVTRLGYNGVQLFFLVSAVTMCYMWDGRRGEVAPVRSFFIRRLCRIAPPFWLAIVFYLFWRQLGFLGDSPAGPFDVAVTATFLHGFFPSAINRVVPGGWSIAAEVGFYALFPLLIMQVGDARRRMTWALASYLLCTAIASWLWLEGGPQLDLFLYYSMLTQLPVFLVGMVAYSLSVRRERVSPLFAATLVAIWLAAAEAAKARGLPGRPGLWLEVGMLATVTAVVVGRFESRFLAFVGRFSYSAYLFHFAIIDILVLLAPDGWRRGTLPFLSAFAATCALTGIVAWGSSKSIESWSTSIGRALIRRMNSPEALVRS